MEIIEFPKQANEFPKLIRRSGLREAIKLMEERIGTSLDLIEAGDPEAIATMERSMMRETLIARSQLIGKDTNS